MAEGSFVVDASPLILLARIDRLDLLRRPGAEVVAPAAVLDEVLAGRDVHPELSMLAGADWLRVAPDLAPPPEIASWDLGRGEEQVLAVVCRRPSCEAVLDDLQARRCAQALGLPVVGTLGLILRAKRRGDLVTARPVVEELLRMGLYLAEPLVRAALAEIGE